MNDPSSLSNFGHAETRRGDVTTGSYFVALPDGRLQTVIYTVDKVNGYRAKVSIETLKKKEELFFVSNIHL